VAGRIGVRKDRKHFFFEKRSKKLLYGCRGLSGTARQSPEFFGSFFQKRTASFPVA
jgi:hypothetical protein